MAGKTAWSVGLESQDKLVLDAILPGTILGSLIETLGADEEDHRGMDDLQTRKAARVSGRRAQTSGSSRAEPGCEFFDITLSLDQPDVAIVAECFADEAHNVTPQMIWFRENMAHILSDGRFHTIHSDQIRVCELHFD